MDMQILPIFSFLFHNNSVETCRFVDQISDSEHVFYCSWCHRIFPIQATCSLNEKELQEVVSMLVKKFVAANQDKLQRPLKVQYIIIF